MDKDKPSAQFVPITSQLSPALPRTVISSNKGVELFLGANRKILVTGSEAEGGYLVQVRSTKLVPHLQTYKPVSKPPKLVDTAEAVRQILKALRA